MIIYQMACPKMFLHMTGVTIGLFFAYGCLVKMSLAGGSVASARAPRVSMTKLTQSICTALRGESLKTTEPKKTMNMATTLTES